MQIRLESDRVVPSDGAPAPSPETSSNLRKGIVGGGKDQRYRFTVLADGLLRLEWAPDGIFEDRPSSFALHRERAAVPDFELRDDGGDEGNLHIITKRFKLTYNKGEFAPHGLFANVFGHAMWRFREKFTDWDNINLKGTARTLDMIDGRRAMWNGEDMELDDGIMAKRGYALLDDSESMLFDDGFVAPRRPGAYKDDSVSGSGGTRLDMYLFAYGRDYRAALKDFYRISGDTPLLPRYSLGNWWSRYYKYTTESYLNLMDTFAANKIPLSVAVIDMDWHLVDDKRIDEAGGNGWTGYTWNRDFFPDPPAFMAELHRRKLKTTLNDHPAEGIQTFEDVYDEVARFLNVTTGDHIPFEVSPAYLKAYFDIVLRGLERDGCDFWWIDWQQGTYSAVRGVDPLRALNHFHYEHMKKKTKPSVKTPMIFSRYGGPGSHRYPVGFSGDTVTTWASLDFQPEFTATASNIGYGWWSHDIGGHQFGVRDDELIVRWVQLGVLSPIMRLHSTQNRWVTKEPWRLGGPGAIVADWLRFRHRLLPYLYTMNVRASHDGEPLVQPMYWEYPAREEAFSVRNQFLFGSEMFVVPVTSPNDRGMRLGRVEGWLPPGYWVDYFSGNVYRGDRMMAFNRTLDTSPVFLGKGAIVPLDANPEPENGTDNPAGFEVVVVVGADGSFELLEDPEDDGREETTATEQKFDCFPIKYTQATGTVEIGALKPAGSGSGSGPSSRSTSRSWSIRFLGAALPSSSSSSSSSILINGKPITQASLPQRQPNGLVIPLGDVPTSTSATVSLGADPQLRTNDVKAMVEPIIMDAQVEFDDKDKVWAALEDDASTAVKLTRLQTMEADEALKGFVTECLLADA